MSDTGSRGPGPQEGAPAGWRQVGKRVGCAVIVSAGAVMFGLTVHHGVQGTIADQTAVAIKQARIGDHVEECTYKAIRRKLPEGATVYVQDYWHGNNARLTDLETLWTVPEVNPAKAQWTLFLGRGRACFNGTVEVRHR